MSQKTDWFSGACHPVRPGVYERTMQGVVHFSRWDGLEWKIYWPSVGFAAREAGRSHWQNLPWRGLAKSPDQVDAAVAAGVGSGA